MLLLVWMRVILNVYSSSTASSRSYSCLSRSRSPLPPHFYSSCFGWMIYTTAASLDEPEQARREKKKRERERAKRGKRRRNKEIKESNIQIDTTAASSMRPPLNVEKGKCIQVCHPYRWIPLPLHLPVYMSAELQSRNGATKTKKEGTNKRRDGSNQNIKI